MVAPLVIMTQMMSPFLSTPAWFVDWTLVEWVHLLHALHFLHLLPIHSLGPNPFGIGMIDVSSYSGSSWAAHKWYNY